MEPTASPPKGIASSLLAAVIDAAGGEPGPGIVQKWPLKATDCPVYAVTVFTDRAEVTRAISLRPDEIGQHEITVEGLSELVVADSLRVNGTGNCRILEVSYVNEEPVEEDRSGEVAVLSERIRKVEEDIAALQRSSDVIDSNVKLIEKFAEVSLKAPESDGTKAPTPLALDYVESVLEMRSTRLEAAAASLRDLANRKRVAQQELGDLKKELKTLTGGDKKKKGNGKAVTISIHVTAPGSIELQLIYLVSGNASWTPSYDLRVDSKTNSLSVTYYGRIQQNTGEDWKDTRLTLSTASPGVGGVPPPLPTKRFVLGSDYVATNLSYIRASAMSMAEEMDTQNSMLEDLDLKSEILSESAFKFRGKAREYSRKAEPVTSRVSSPSTSSSGVGASATFLIDRVATIDSDDKPHKVTIAILNMASTFRHYCVPKMSPMAYVQALCTNTSDYVLLASAAVNVFFDGSFVSTTAIQNVSPGETFRSFLGVDAAVRIEYRDFGPKASRSGMFSKSSVTTHKFATTIRNSKLSAINLILADVYPTSADSKIKVIAVEPSQSVIDEGTSSETVARGGAFDDLAVGEVGGSGDGAADVRSMTFRDVVARNPLSNNIVWSRRIAGNTTVVVPLEYRVETPVGMNIRLA